MNFKKLFCILFIIIFSILMPFGAYCNGVTFNANAPSAILFNVNTEKILYEKNAYEKRYPASTTKIMTAILTLENCNLNDTATVSSTAVILPPGYISAHLQVGEVLTINELLHLLLIISSNDAANVLAEHIAGSVSNFSNMMNDKAKEIGCLNTHFVNPNGAQNTNHYSTAYDLCLIANYAMKNETFRKLVSIDYYTVPATNKYEERKLTNTNALLQQVNEKTKTKNIYYYEYAIGIKTGYTNQAKNCLVAGALKDGTEFISVVLKADLNESDNNSERFADSKKLLETAIDNYRMFPVKKANDLITTVKIQNALPWNKDLNLLLENDITLLLEIKDMNTEIKPEIKLFEDKLNAPINKGDVLGTATFTYDGTSVSSNIIAENDISTSEQFNKTLKIVGIIILILIVLRMIAIRNKKKRRARMRRRTRRR